MTDPTSGVMTNAVPSPNGGVAAMAGLTGAKPDAVSAGGEALPGAAMRGGAEGGWADALDADLRAVAAAKGWQSAGDAVRSYASLERLLGADKIALPPANAPASDWDAVWDRLGRPSSSMGYKFEKPEGYDAYSDELAEWARKTCHKVGMPAPMAAAFHDEFVTFARGLTEANENRSAMNDVELHAFVEREWGSARDDKLGAFRRAANAFMDSPQSLDRLQQLMGTPELLKMFVKIGEWLGEDRAVGTGQSSFRLTREEAEQEFSKIRQAAIADPKHALMDKLHPDHQKQVERVETLMRTIYPE
ncbi:MAG: hypothetical protein WD044_00020 [Dongiaceae bacterium]